jgi:iron-only hydrogenase group A
MLFRSYSTSQKYSMNSSPQRRFAMSKPKAIQKDYGRILQDVKQNGKKIVVQIAPAVRVTISEGFGLEPGTITTQQLVSGLKHLGIDYVFDTLWSADATILEEGTEFLNKLVAGQLENMPLLTSCCPGWIELVEKSFPSIMEHVSTTKSPMMIMGASIKNVLPNIIGIEAKNLYSVALMPCVRKQGEADKYGSEEERHVDLVITTNDAIKLFKENNIDLSQLEGMPFDNPFGSGTGGAVIFGKSKGVMIAALRYAHLLLTKEQLPEIEFSPVEGFKDVIEAKIELIPHLNNPLGLPSEKISFKVAVVSGLGGVKRFIEYLANNKTEYKFVEVMACPGGCVAGAGNPNVGKNKNLVIDRRNALDKLDTDAIEKASQENADVMKFYEDHLGGEPNGYKAHDLFHRH